MQPICFAGQTAGGRASNARPYAIDLCSDMVLRNGTGKISSLQGGGLHLHKFRAIITLSAIDKRQAVSPLYIQGRILPPDSLERGAAQ